MQKARHLEASVSGSFSASESLVNRHLDTNGAVQISFLCYVMKGAVHQLCAQLLSVSYCSRFLAKCLQAYSHLLYE